MKNLVLIALFALSSATALRAADQGETTLYDSHGEPQAYIDYSNQMTVYLWSGEPVGYLELKAGEVFNVWGFNGKHLGWFSGGILRNDKGYIVGATKVTFSGPVQAEPAKMSKRPPPIRTDPEYWPSPPRPRMEWTQNGSVRSLLLQGKYD